MELEIVGFKCYRKAKFTFPASGITLLKGPSGQGKSTILKAIIWCLYGNMRNVDQKTCRGSKLSVTIRTTIKGGKKCVIYRQKRPNLLKFRVGRFEQIDAVAQERINELYGSEKLWLLCSYLQQKKSNRLFEVPGPEKLDLLNKIAFHESNPTPYINKIEEWLREEKLRFDVLQENYNKECASFTEFLEFQTIELNNAISDEEMKQMKEEIKTINQEITILRQRYLKHREAVSALEVVNQRIKLLEGKRKELQQFEEEEMENVSLPLDECAIQSLNEKVQAIDQDIYVLQRVLQQKQFLDQAKTRLNQIEAKYITYKDVALYEEKDLYEIQSQHSKFQGNKAKAVNMGIIYDRLHIDQELQFLSALLKIQPALKIHKNIVNLHEKLVSTQESGCCEEERDLEGEITTQQEIIYTLKQGKHVLSCPQCGHHVRYIKGGLESCDHKPSTEEDLMEAYKKLEKLQDFLRIRQEREKLIEQYTNLTKAYEEEISVITQTDLHVLGDSRSHLLSPLDLEDSKRKHLTLHSIEILEEPTLQISEVKAGIEKHNIEVERQRCMSDLKIQEEEYANLQKLTPSVGNEKELHHQKTILQQRIQKYITHLSLQETVTKDLEEANRQKSDLYKQLEYGLEEEITAKELRLSSIQKTIETAAMANEARRKQEELIRKREELVEISQKVYYLERLKGIAVEVECKVLQQTVDSINATINVFAEAIFEEPIRVELKLYRKIKTTKKIKPMVNIEIRHKGGIYENPSEVSGGEEDRLSLLLTLALNRLSGSPLLLIDETFSSLDDELKTHCLRSIKSVASNKLVVCVDHASIEGYYDQVLNIEH